MPSRDNNFIDSMSRYKRKIIGGAILGGFVALGVFAASRYRVAGPTEYIVRTGPFLNGSNVAISKYALQLPFQTYTQLNMSPITYHINVSAMSIERIPFKMPVVCTISPQDKPEALERYVNRLIDKDPIHLKETIDGIIQGEARTLAAKLGIDQLLQDRDTYNNGVTQHIATILDQYGLKIDNANISELMDSEGNNYFSEQKKRALNQVNQQARKDVAEAIKDGETGEKSNQVQARQTVARLEMEAKLAENTRAIEIAESEKNRAVAEAGYQKEREIAKATAKAEEQQRTLELQQKVEIARTQQKIAAQQAEQLSATKVQAETFIVEAQGKAAAAIEEAKGYAAAAIAKAEADATVKKIKAEADLVASQKEAEGIFAREMAEAKGYEARVKAANGDIQAVNENIKITKGQYEKVAVAHELGQSIKDMKPTLWVTSGSTDNGLSEQVQTGIKKFIPFFETLKKQSGINLLKPLGLEPETVNDIQTHQIR